IVPLCQLMDTCIPDHGHLSSCPTRRSSALRCEKPLPRRASGTTVRSRLPISPLPPTIVGVLAESPRKNGAGMPPGRNCVPPSGRSEEHTPVLQSRENLVGRVRLEEKNEYDQ